jgi:hypothetical protein
MACETEKKISPRRHKGREGNLGAQRLFSFSSCLRGANYFGIDKEFA